MMPVIKQLTTPLILLLFMLSSCVPNRKMAYLQFENELNDRNSILTDSILRTYSYRPYLYTFQPDDQIDIKISTTTPEEYNPYALADRYMSTGGTNMQSSQSSLMGYRVDPQGFINLPVIGLYKVSGLNVFDLEDSLTLIVAKELEDPVVKVNLLNFRYTLLGEVGAEGMKTTSDYSLTILQAIAQAGGPTDFGDLSRIKVVRKNGNESQIFYVNLLTEDHLSANYLFVHPNDLIIISPMQSRNYIKSIPQTIGIIASGLSFIVSIITLVSVQK